MPLTAASLRALAERPDEPLTQDGLVGLVWPADDRRVLRHRAAALAADPSAWRWLLHAALEADGRLVGRIGCHEAPVVGQVEVGYAVAAGARGRGVATRMLHSFLDWLRAQKVDSVLLSVRPDNEASLRLARRAGFRLVGEREDEEDGRELVLALVLRSGTVRPR